MWVCKNCGSEIDNDRLLSCWNCGHGKDGTPPVDRAEFEEAKSIDTRAHPPGTPHVGERGATYRRGAAPDGYVSALRIFGWVALVAGVVSGLFLFLSSLDGRPLKSESNARLYYIFVALAVIFQGVFVFVLCQVVAGIAEEVGAVRYELYSRRQERARRGGPRRARPDFAATSLA